jgi:transcriptional regulator with XRE-family HTH domain
MSLEQFRSRRQEKGYSYEKLAKYTGIPKEWIIAIEEEDFSKFPNSFVARNAIRTYARFFNINPEPLLFAYHKYEQELQKRNQDFEVPLRRTRKRKRKKGLNVSLPQIQKKWMILGLGALFLMLIPLTYFLFFDHREVVMTAAPKQMNYEDLLNAKDQSRPVLELKKPAEISKEGDIYELKNARQVEVSLVALEPTAIRVRENGPTGKILDEKTLQAGEKVQYVHEKWLVVRIENPSKVKLYVNGIEVDTSEMKDPGIFQFQLAE